MKKRLSCELTNDSAGWIPVTERLPEDGYYLATLDDELVGQEEPFTGMCGIENGNLLIQENVRQIHQRLHALPEPYREE